MWNGMREHLANDNRGNAKCWVGRRVMGIISALMKDVSVDDGKVCGKVYMLEELAAVYILGRISEWTAKLALTERNKVRGWSLDRRMKEVNFKHGGMYVKSIGRRWK